MSPGSGSGRGVTPQTVAMGPQVQGLGVVTLEMWTCEPWAGLGGDHSGDCGYMSPGARYGKWGHPDTVGVRPQVQGLEGGVILWNIFNSMSQLDV